MEYMHLIFMIYRIYLMLNHPNLQSNSKGMKPHIHLYIEMYPPKKSLPTRNTSSSNLNLNIRLDYSNLGYSNLGSTKHRSKTKAKMAKNRPVKSNANTGQMSLIVSGEDTAVVLSPQ